MHCAQEALATFWTLRSVYIQWVFMTLTHCPKLSVQFAPGLDSYLSPPATGQSPSSRLILPPNSHVPTEKPTVQMMTSDQRPSHWPPLGLQHPPASSHLCLCLFQASSSSSALFNPPLLLILPLLTSRESSGVQ